MTAPEQQAADPRQPAWDAVFAYIRTLPREGGRPSVVERNAMIWRGVNAALVAVGYPGEYEQAAPEQADLHQRIAEAILADIKRATMPLRLLPGQVGHLGARTHYDLADAVLAVPELAALREQLAAETAARLGLRNRLDRVIASNARLRAELGAVDDELTAQYEHNDATCEAVAERDRLRAQVQAARDFADEMRGYCSPHGVAALYADRLTDRLDTARPTT